MNKYQYQPLLPGEIRLLRLHPAPDPGRDLTGSVLHHELTNPTYHRTADGPYLEHKLAYEAVSYHWGSNTRTPFTLLVRDDGADPSSPASTIPLTTTLHTLLRQLVYPDRPRVVWVDAICINQVLSADNAEKGSQIRLMPDIYRVASRVLVYLGPATATSALALSFMEHISEYSSLLDESLPTADFDAAVASGFVLPALDAPEWPALRAFWRRPWFRRVWIIQEFVYATEVVVLCGPREIDWRRLWLAAKAYVDNGRLCHAGFRARPTAWWDIPLLFVPWYQERVVDEWRQPHEGARAMFTVGDARMRAWGYMTGAYMIFNLGERDESRDRWRDPLPVKKDLGAIRDFEEFSMPTLLENRARGKAFPFGREGLLSLLAMTQNFMATHPVDRMYALLGLAGDVDGPEFEPVYAKEQTVAAVSTRFATGLIRKGKGPQVLASARLVPPGAKTSRGEKEMPPSWVPDWTTVTHVQDKHITFSMPADKPEDDEPSPSPGAAVATTTTPSQTDDENDEREAEKPPKREFSFYSASGTHPFHHRLDPSTNALFVRIIPVDVVGGLVHGRLMLGLATHERMIKQALKTYPTGESVDSALWRTQIGNRTNQGEVPGAAHRAAYEATKARDAVAFQTCALLVVGPFVLLSPLSVAVLRLLPAWTHALALGTGWFTGYLSVADAGVLGVVVGALRWLRWLFALPLFLGFAYWGVNNVWYNEVVRLIAWLGATSLGTPGAVPPECEAYATAMGRVMNKYNLGTTHAGLLGLFPPGAVRGDLIAVILGCEAPFVLRLDEGRTAHENRWKLVGECYVHGIMDGEVAGYNSDEIGLY